MAEITLSYAQEMLGLWQECERQLATGQAKSYKIGSREYTSLDLNEIVNRIAYWKNQVDVLSGKKRTNRAVRVVPRDL